MKGRVIRSTGSWYTVKNVTTNEWVQCRMKGKFRLDGSTTTNPIAIGDFVDFEVEEGLDTALIVYIYPRNNYIVRQSSHRKYLRHIVAANIDQAILIVTFSKPRTSLGFIDRFILTAEMYHIPVVLVFNKQDAYKKKDIQKYERAKHIYESLGYTCLLTSATTGYGLDELKACMKDKTSLLAGHSGVGKSSLANCLDEKLHLATKVISRYTEKGQHTTTHAEIYDLPFGASIIDTPGIKEFGIVSIEPIEIGHYFVEMKALMGNCHFNDCLHINEKKCAVKDAIENGIVSEERYKNYVNIVNSIQDINYWERN
jgi:ribosome biogenesis GTPase